MNHPATSSPDQGAELDQRAGTRQRSLSLRESLRRSPYELHRGTLPAACLHHHARSSHVLNIKPVAASINVKMRGLGSPVGSAHIIKATASSGNGSPVALVQPQASISRSNSGGGPNEPRCAPRARTCSKRGMWSPSNRVSIFRVGRGAHRGSHRGHGCRAGDPQPLPQGTDRALVTSLTAEAASFNGPTAVYFQPFPKALEGTVRPRSNLCLATLNILRGRRFPPATAHVQFSRSDNEGDCMPHERMFASPPGFALRLCRSRPIGLTAEPRFPSQINQAVPSVCFNGWATVKGIFSP